MRCLISSVILVFLAGCSKSDISGDVGFYAIKDFKLTGQYAIDESSVRLSNEILISYDDLLTYHAGEHRFAISPALGQEIDIDQHSTGYFKKPFAVAIGKEIIYTGYFWSLISSSACDWTTAIPIGEHLFIHPGYPDFLQAQPGQDRRNDRRILEIFRRDGKLIE